MSYCLNPSCSYPENPPQATQCQACGSALILRDRYRVSQLLGKGGFGATFLAEDISLPGQPTCVIKQLRPNTNSPQLLTMARELFVREAKTLGKLGSHPQLPRLLDYFELAEEFCLVQEYVSGLTLQQELKRSGPMAEAEVRRILQDLLPVLDYLQQQEVIHRDIKPANIIRRAIDGKLILIDFGAVKDQVTQLARANATGDTVLTAFAIGTPGFSPPEQVAMRPVYASDLYGLGMTCVYLLTGKTPQELGYSSQTGELCWQDSLTLSASFTAVLSKMLEASVRDRFQSAKAVLQALELEPHQPQLAQGLALQRSSLGPNPNSRVQPAPGSPPGTAIRATREHSPSPLAAANHGRSTSTTRIHPPHPDSRGRTPATLNAAGLQAAYRQGKRDFAELDLRALNLRNFQLAGAIFHQAKLQQTNLQGANLVNANLGKANLTGALLQGALLNKAYLNYANLEGADLEGADLSDAYLSNANLQGTNLRGANLTGAKLSDQQLAVARTNRATILPNGKRAGGWWR
jgi:serine/threonine protein kinase, bacterial